VIEDQSHRRTYLFDNINDLHNFISQFNSLKHLDIVCALNHVDPAHTPLSLLELETLLIEDNVSHIVPLINSFDLPNARKITICLGKGSNYYDELKVSSLFEWTRNRIQRAVANQSAGFLRVMVRCGASAPNLHLHFIMYHRWTLCQPPSSFKSNSVSKGLTIGGLGGTHPQL
jgi:hypothetical protein